MRKILISALIAGSAVAAAPASAQAFRVQPMVQRQIQSEINQLDSQISRAVQRRTVSQREAIGLRRQAMQVQRSYNLFARNGLDRGEVASLQSQLNSLRARLRLERRDFDNRRF
jgi:hypothetical protein